ncbi:HIT family protein [Actinomadura geliboluensis]|uniref:HIT family protein n=1 Tax=Actinomadura geliboluensis TaxID=882440 RepID=UPI00372458C1
MIDCPFCDPARSRILARSGGWYARFDNYPATPWHVEIVPFEHVDSWFDLSPDVQMAGMSLLAEAADIITSMRQVDAFNWGVNDGPAAGRTIDHLHIHLIPRQFGDQRKPEGGLRLGLPNGDPTKWVTPQVQAPAVARDGSTGSGT